MSSILGPITVRNLPPAVARAVPEKARREKLSLNKTIVKLLEEATGEAKKTPALHHDRDHLAGRWSEEEYLRRQGTPVSPNGLWIAATAAQHGLIVVTLDGGFDRIPQILAMRLDPLPQPPRS